LEAKRILLVDDDETTVTPFQLILESEGYQVDVATTGRQALEKMGEGEYHVVILEIKLPDMLGIEVAKKIKMKKEDVNLIVITGYPNLTDSIKTIDYGISDILLKPIDPDELLRTIEEAIRWRMSETSRASSSTSYP
jgi:DNA-binding response OmpR family regulator